MKKATDQFQKNDNLYLRFFFKIGKNARTQQIGIAHFDLTENFSVHFLNFF